MKTLSYFIVAVLAALALSCGPQHPEPLKGNSLLSDSIIRNVQTAKVISEDEYSFVKLNGKIQPNEAKQVRVFALVSGNVEAVNVELGDYVKKNQVLAELKSTEVAQISNDLSVARSNVEIAKKNVQSTTEMYQGKLATEKDLLTAKLNYNNTLSELNRAEQVSAIIGGNSSSYLVRSPISGFIVDKNVTNNSEVRADNSTDLFVIADLSSVWIIANVYEADINNIHLNDSVKVNTLANPEKDYVGKIDKIYSVLDALTRTMKVRISMENPTNDLKPEMFATVRVNGKPYGKALTVPSQAIVMDNSKNYVVLRKDHALAIHEIKLLKRVDDRAYIQGLALGDEVVINSPLFLYQALSTN